jgi:hypothetical protein
MESFRECFFQQALHMCLLQNCKIRRSDDEYGKLLWNRDRCNFGFYCSTFNFLATYGQSLINLRIKTGQLLIKSSGHHHVPGTSCFHFSIIRSSLIPTINKILYNILAPLHKFERLQHPIDFRLVDYYLFRLLQATEAVSIFNKFKCLLTVRNH